MRKRTRGSVFVFTVIMVLMTTTLVIASSVLTASTRSSEGRREQDAIADASFQGVLNQIKADSTAAALNLPVIQNYTCGNQTWSVTASDNSASLARSILVTATTTIRAATYTKTSVIVQRFTSNPLNYCLALNSAENFPGTVTTGSAGTNGDVYVNGAVNFSLLPTSTINGDLETTSNTVTGNYTVTGNQLKSQTAVTFPALAPATYQASATTSYAAGTTLNNVSFPAPSGSTYPIFYINGAGNLKGTITGDGVIFVNGNLNVNSNITYANGSSRVAVIVNGNAVLTGGCTSIVGYWYVKGTVNAAGITARTVNPGAVTAGGLATGSLSLTVKYDPDIFTYPSEGKKYCLPGFWP